MARTAALIAGVSTIGEVSAPDSTTPATNDGGNIIGDDKGTITIAASGSRNFDISTIMPALVTGLSYCWLKGTDSNGDPFPFSIEWDIAATVDIPTCTEFLWSIKTATESVDNVVVNNLSGSGILTLEYLLAGQ